MLPFSLSTNAISDYHIGVALATIDIITITINNAADKCYQCCLNKNSYEIRRRTTR